MTERKLTKKKPIIAFCGDICSECPRFIATLSNDPKELSAVADLWFRAGFRDHVVDNAEIQCKGCSRTKTCGYEINSCIHLKNKESCGDCELFPCSKLDTMFKRAAHFEASCVKKCSSKEIEQLRKAFFNKKEILENIHQKTKR